MKQILKMLFSLMLIMPAMVVLADDNKDGKGKSPDVIPLELRKQTDFPMTYSLTYGMTGYVIVEESGTVGFILPFESYPADVTITGEGTTMGCWTSTLANDADVMPFDGGEGDYCLEISTPDGSYVGYFTLE